MQKQKKVNVGLTFIPSPTMNRVNVSVEKKWNTRTCYGAA